MTRICIIDPETVNDIEKCPGCNYARNLSISCSGSERRAKCNCINEEAPEVSDGLKTIFIGEAPTDGTRFFMNRKDPASGGGDSLPTRVWEVIQKNGDKQLSEDIAGIDERLDKTSKAIAKKGLILDAMKRNGCAFLDCCQCITTQKKGSKRERLLESCFKTHALGILATLHINHPDAVIVPCYQTCDKILEDCGHFDEVDGKGRYRSWKMKQNDATALLKKRGL
jgi:hypothetical protein